MPSQAHAVTTAGFAAAVTIVAPAVAARHGAPLAFAAPLAAAVAAAAFAAPIAATVAAACRAATARRRRLCCRPSDPEAQGSCSSAKRC